MRLASAILAAALLSSPLGTQWVCAQTATKVPVAEAASAAKQAESKPAVRGQLFESTRIEKLPEQYSGVGVKENLNTRLPLEASFVDENGESATLGQYFRSGRPVIVQMGYLSCPMLCDLVSQGTADSLGTLDLKLGVDYDVLFISIDPKETPKLAAGKKRTFLSKYALEKGLDGKALETAGNGWHFLTAAGDEEAIQKVATATGFQYKWVEAAGQYSHPAVITLITPAGSVSRYLYGVKFDPKVLRLSLVETSQGKVGSVMDQILMYCLHFDASSGQYTLFAKRLMQLAGALTVLCLTSTLGIFTLKSRMTRGLPPRSRGLSAVLSEGQVAAPAGGFPVNSPPGGKT